MTAPTTGVSSLFEHPRVRVLVTRRAFRLLVAVALLGIHLLAMTSIAKQRLGVPFDRAPGQAPTFEPANAPVQDTRTPRDWNRLAASRWDSQHYLATALRGYSLCAPQDLSGKRLVGLLPRCAFHFYPGYPALGWLVAKLTGLAADYALLAVSLSASLAFLFLWTGPALRERLGLANTYLSLFLFNAFTTGFALITLQTEPITLLAGLATFVLLFEKRYLAAALVAGSAGTFRVTGGAIGLAFALALFASALLDESEPARLRWRRLAVCAPLAGWGQLAVFAFFWIRYGDPLLYVHAHGQAFGHEVSLTQALFPQASVLARSLSLGPREGLFVCFALLWLGLGLREALSSFSLMERVYWVGSLVITIGVALLGSAGLAYAGMNRYWLAALPLFFAMACVLGRRPAALVVWTAFSLWSYWEVDLCSYVVDRGAERLCGVLWVP